MECTECRRHINTLNESMHVIYASYANVCKKSTSYVVALFNGRNTHSSREKRVYLLMTFIVIDCHVTAAFYHDYLA